MCVFFCVAENDQAAALLERCATVLCVVPCYGAIFLCTSSLQLLCDVLPVRCGVMVPQERVDIEAEETCTCLEHVLQCVCLL